MIDWNNVSYSVTVINLSFADGEMHLCLSFDGSCPDVGSGEECGLRLLEENNPFPFRYIAKVIRVGPSEIVVSILGMNRVF